MYLFISVKYKMKMQHKRRVFGKLPACARDTHEVEEEVCINKRWMKQPPWTRSGVSQARNVTLSFRITFFSRRQKPETERQTWRQYLRGGLEECVRLSEVALNFTRSTLLLGSAHSLTTIFYIRRRNTLFEDLWLDLIKTVLKWTLVVWKVKTRVGLWCFRHS